MSKTTRSSRIAIGIVIGALFVSLVGRYYLERSKDESDRRGEAALTGWRTAVVDQLAKRHNASVDWMSRDRHSCGTAEPLYTLDVEKMFLRDPKQPILFVGKVVDLIQVRNAYEILFTTDITRSWEDPTFPTLFERRPFQFRLLCTEDFARLILKQREYRPAEVKSSSQDTRYAVVADIVGIEKVERGVAAANPLAADRDYFRVKGSCRDLISLGRYGFWYSQ